MAKTGALGLMQVTREPARKSEARRPLRLGEQAPQALESRRACYGQPFSGLRERAQKMAAVAPVAGGGDTDSAAATAIQLREGFAMAKGIWFFGSRPEK